MLEYWNNIRVFIYPFIWLSQMHINIGSSVLHHAYSVTSSNVVPHTVVPPWVDVDRNQEPDPWSLDRCRSPWPKRGLDGIFDGSSVTVMAKLGTSFPWRIHVCMPYMVSHGHHQQNPSHVSINLPYIRIRHGFGWQSNPMTDPYICYW